MPRAKSKAKSKRGGKRAAPYEETHPKEDATQEEEETAVVSSQEGKEQQQEEVKITEDKAKGQQEKEGNQQQKEASAVPAVAPTVQEPSTSAIEPPSADVAMDTTEAAVTAPAEEKAAETTAQQQQAAESASSSSAAAAAAPAAAATTTADAAAAAASSSAAVATATAVAGGAAGAAAQQQQYDQAALDAAAAMYDPAIFYAAYGYDPYAYYYGQQQQAYGQYGGAQGGQQQGKYSVGELAREAERCKSIDEVSALMKRNASTLSTSVRAQCVCLRALGRLAQRDQKAEQDNLSAAQNANRIFSQVSGAKECMDRVVGVMRVQAFQFTTQDLADLVWGLARLGVKDLEVFRTIAREVQTRGTQFTVQQLKDLVWGFVRNLDLNNTRGGLSMTTHDQALFSYLASQLKSKNISELTPHDTADVVRSFAKLGFRDLDLLRHIGPAIINRQQHFSDRDMGACIQAYTRFGVPLRGTCELLQRPKQQRDWERPPPPTKPKPMSACGQPSDRA